MNVGDRQPLFSSGTTVITSDRCH